MKDQEVETEKLYKVELNRTHKTTFGKKNKKVVHIAPEGHIFLVVICRIPSKEGVNKYSKHFAILSGTPQERIDEMAEAMYWQIKKQFSL